MSPFILSTERANMENSRISTRDTVQNHEILRLPIGNLHLTPWNMQSYQSLSNSLYGFKKNFPRVRGGLAKSLKVLD